jgi:hypothetical protein
MGSLSRAMNSCCSGCKGAAKGCRGRRCHSVAAMCSFTHCPMRICVHQARPRAKSTARVRAMLAELCTIQLAIGVRANAPATFRSHVHPRCPRAPNIALRMPGHPCARSQDSKAHEVGGVHHSERCVLVHRRGDTGVVSLHHMCCMTIDFSRPCVLLCSMLLSFMHCFQVPGMANINLMLGFM